MFQVGSVQLGFAAELMPYGCPLNVAEVKNDYRFENTTGGGAYYNYLSLIRTSTSNASGLGCGYNENGKLVFEQFFSVNDGKVMNHSKKLYYESGNLEMVAPMRNSHMEGIARQYYESGKLQLEIPFKRSEIDGTLKGYYENGKLRSELQYRKGKQEGIAKEYYESGKLRVESQYKSDRKEGQEKIFREGGKLGITIVYKNGSPVNGQCHHSDGTTTALTEAELTNFLNNLEVTCR